MSALRPGCPFQNYLQKMCYPDWFRNAQFDEPIVGANCQFHLWLAHHGDGRPWF